MTMSRNPIAAWFTALALVVGGNVAHAATEKSEADALSLEGDAPKSTTDAAKPLRIYIEGALGNASQRYLPGSQNLARASFDLAYSAPIGNGLRFAISNRLDRVHPTAAGADSTINSLREAYVSWQAEGGATVVEFGRINLRYGTAYGFNPTDFFRDGSLRTRTTANPFALRDNRLGTVMLRGQQLWSGGSLSVAYSPKLVNRPSADGWSLDLGSTNNRDRWVVALGTQFSQKVNGQFLIYKEEGNSATIGASGAALLSDAATAHVEWTRGREPDLASRSLVTPVTNMTRSRLAVGGTYTTAGKLSVTAEYQYNGFALGRQAWQTLGATSPVAQIAYLSEAQRLQDLVPQRAALIYVTQKGLAGVKDLDLTAFIRFNLLDQSRIAWVELRHHWAKYDLAMQLQQNMGRITSEFGIQPDRRVIQVVGTYYF